MLVISDAEWQRAIAAQISSFSQSAASALRSTHPEESQRFTDEELLEFVKKNVNRGKKYGISKNEEVLDWLKLNLEMVPLRRGQGLII